eukprot:1340726-Prorocentrum_lima.AAC.1
MRAHFMCDLIGAKLITIEYVPSQGNPADALTKGLTAAATRPRPSYTGRDGAIVPNFPYMWGNA